MCSIGKHPRPPACGGLRGKNRGFCTLNDTVLRASLMQAQNMIDEMSDGCYHMDELELIHPFADGSGRVRHLWHMSCSPNGMACLHNCLSNSLCTTINRNTTIPSIRVTQRAMDRWIRELYAARRLSVSRRRMSIS